MKIAILISGHTRGCDHLPLFEGKHDIDVFASVWKSDDVLVSPTVIETEKEVPGYFTRRYYSEEYKKYPGLSGPDTCGNAVSMWYKVNRACQLCLDYSETYGKQYDVIIRYRPDIICDTPITDEQLENCVNDTLYMPKWHGKYPSVTMEMMDHFFFGAPALMLQVCSLYLNIDLEDTTIPHSAEGFLYKATLPFKLERFETSYQVQRSGYREKVV